MILILLNAAYSWKEKNTSQNLKKFNFLSQIPKKKKRRIFWDTLEHPSWYEWGSLIQYVL